MEHIGKRIKALRLRRDLTQEKLAELLNVTAQAVSKWENGVSWPDVSLLPELSAVLGVTLDELFDTSGELHLRRIEKMLVDDAALGEEDFRYAERQLEEGCARAEARSKCLTLLADLYLNRAEQYKRLAAERAKEALAIEPENHGAHAALCRAADGVLHDWCITNHTELIDYYRDFTAKHPESRSGYIWQLPDLLADGRLTEARDALEKLRALRDGYHYELYLGLIAERSGDLAEAEHCYDRMLEKYPDDWSAWSQRGDVCVKRADYGRALYYYREAVKRHTERPRFIDNYQSIAQICEITGDRAGAIDAYAHVIELLRDDWGFAEGATVAKYRAKIERLKAE